MLRKLGLMQGLTRHTIWYCQYSDPMGEDHRAKPTDIWTNDESWLPRPVCKNGNRNCHHQPAPRGSKSGTQGMKDAIERSKIPPALFYEILQNIAKR